MFPQQRGMLSFRISVIALTVGFAGAEILGHGMTSDTYTEDQAKCPICVSVIGDLWTQGLKMRDGCLNRRKWNSYECSKRYPTHEAVHDMVKSACHALPQSHYLHNDTQHFLDNNPLQEPETKSPRQQFKLRKAPEPKQHIPEGNEEAPPRPVHHTEDNAKILVSVCKKWLHGHKQGTEKIANYIFTALEADEEEDYAPKLKKVMCWGACDASRRTHLRQPWPEDDEHAEL